MSSHLTPYLLARSFLTKIFVRVYLGQTDDIRQGTRSQMLPGQVSHLCSWVTGNPTQTGSCRKGNVLALITEELEGEGGLQVQLDPGLK